MNYIIQIIDVLIWPILILVLILIFKKKLYALFFRIKEIDISKKNIKFGESPIDKIDKKPTISSTPELDEKVAKLSIKWNKSGALYWLSCDLMWTIDVLLRGAPRDRIIHGLSQSLLNLQEVGLTGSIVESKLTRMKDESKISLEEDWTRERRINIVNELKFIRNAIGELAIENQPGFKHSPDD